MSSKVKEEITNPFPDVKGYAIYFVLWFKLDHVNKVNL